LYDARSSLSRRSIIHNQAMSGLDSPFSVMSQFASQTHRAAGKYRQRDRTSPCPILPAWGI